jgi:hypothetical protein
VIAFVQAVQALHGLILVFCVFIFFNISGPVLLVHLDTLSKPAAWIYHLGFPSGVFLRSVYSVVGVGI